VADGEWQTLQGTWSGRFILDGCAIADDGQIVARVVSLLNADPWAKAGVMVRKGLTDGRPLRVWKS
jgi:hypothetical protein